MAKPTYTVVTIYEWPESQNCMDCKYGEYIVSPAFNKSCSLCFLCCPKNNGKYCPRKDKKE